MAERISLEQVRHVAKLARLSLSAAELERMTQDLRAILGHIEQLSKIKTDDVPPTTHAVDLPTRNRDDQTAPSFDVERGLKNAPERIGDGFGVPKIIE